MATAKIRYDGKARRNDLDLVGGLLIIHMIFYHICQRANLDYYIDGILVIMMPWFFFKSGMFFRKSMPYKEQIKSNAKHLLIPFAVFSAIGLVFSWLRLYLSGDHYWLHYISFPKHLLLQGAIYANPPLWFLTSLFLIRIAYNYVAGKANDYIIMAICLAIAFLCHYFNIMQPRYLANCATGMFFFIAGHKLHDIQYNWPICITAVIVYTAIYILHPSLVDMFSNILKTGSYLLWFPFAIAGIVIVNAIAKLIPPSAYMSILIRAICSIGRNSMYYYVLHWIILVIVSIVTDIAARGLAPKAYIAVQCAACLVILPVITHVINKHKILNKLFGVS